MNTASSAARKWNERSSASGVAAGQSNTMFDLLFERSGDAIWLYEPESGVFVDCNQAAVDLMQAGTKQALLQHRPEELSPEFQPDGVRSSQRAAEINALAEKHGSYRFEWVARRLDGQEVPLEVLTTPILADGRRLNVVVSRDISQRLNIEVNLRENQRLLASIADNISEAIYRSEIDHRLTFVNRAYLEIFGYGCLAELQSMPRERLYAEPQVRRELLDTLACQGHAHREIQYIRKDGTRFWGLTSARIVHDPETHKSYQVGAITDVTERKRNEAEILRLNESLERRIQERTAELTASEARLRTLVENAPEAIVVFDGDTGRFLSGNAHVCELYGHCPEELTKLTPSEVSPEFQPDGRRSAEVAQEKMQEALAGGTPVFEWMHRHSSGRLVPTEVRLVRLPAEGKNLLRASIIDNTERTRRLKVQQALYEISEAALTAKDLDGLYRQIHEIIMSLMPAQNFYIAVIDPTTNFIHFPYHVDEATPHPGPCELGTGLTGYVFRLGKPLLVGPAMNALKRKDGDHVTFEGFADIRYVERGVPAAIWVGVPLSTGGSTFGVMAVQDYHNPNAYGESEKQLLSFVAGQVAIAIERKRVEQALRDSEAKFRALFAASSQGVILHDEKQYLELNPAAVRILGYRSPDELMGKSPGDTAPPVQPNGEPSAVLASKHIAACMESGEARFDWVARTATGADIPLEVILTRVEWGGRRIIQAVIHDISARKKAETELLNALAREKELGQLKSNFVSMVSHEFRTPLGVIMSSAEILETYFDRLDPDERREQLQSIQKNTRRMANLMEEVLLLGMVEAGKLDFKPAPLDLPSFASRILDEVLSATNHKCPIQLFVPGQLAPALADERLLGHIFTNLLSNAVKYSPDQSPVSLELHADGRDAVCRISDRGMGIPEQDMEWLFKAFHRGQNVTHVRGSGLGLTIVKRCVELHKGHIKVESAIGQGTKVTVRLPLFAS